MNLTKNQTNDSSNWDEIKNFVGGAKKQPKHPLVQEAERLKQRLPEHYDDGGMVNDPSNILRGTIPPVSAQPVPVVPPPIAPDPNKPYEDKASSILGGLDPTRISSLLENLRQNSNKSQIGAGIAGIGDAIASVGGQNPGHMKSAEEAIHGNYDRALKTPELMANAGKERYGLSQTLQENDPNSPVAKYARETYGPLAQKLGLDVAHASPKMIGDLVGKTVDQLKNEAQEKEAKAIHEQTAAYQDESLSNQKQQIENTKQEHDTQARLGAAESLDKRGMIQKTIDAIHPSAATKFLQGQVVAPPMGRVAVIAPDGTEGHIPQSQLQEAIKKGYKPK